MKNWSALERKTDKFTLYIHWISKKIRGTLWNIKFMFLTLDT